MNYSKEFFHDKTDLPTFAKVRDDLGGDYQALFFFLTEFELWLKKKGALNLSLEAASSSTNSENDEICPFCHGMNSQTISNKEIIGNICPFCHGSGKLHH